MRNNNIKTVEGKTVIKTDTTNSADAQPLTKDKLGDIQLVDTIGRYDNLSMLKIPIAQYAAREDTGEYGIRYKPAVHGSVNGARIRTNQEEAAKLFLSKLRGFGLLADCVGSGKTYEACVVVSELAVRGLIDNLLIIVPDEALLAKWTRVVEKDFGLGVGNLHRIETLGDTEGKEHLVKKRELSTVECDKPRGAYIMMYDGLIKSGIDQVKSQLFDMIVVDEAHNLCKVEDGNMHSMYYLSLLMRTKRDFDKEFCLLLTATPHNGNLEAMFNLWYFIRCKGGTPECFLRNGTTNPILRKEFEGEKDYYRNVVCKGATTVSEYIERAQCELLVGLEGVVNPYRTAFFSQFRSRQGKTYKAITFAEYKDMKSYERKSRARAFLDCNRAIREELNDLVNQSYTNVVMRSIMVRRKNDFSVSRMAHSHFFLPIDSKLKIERVGNVPTSPHFYFDGEAMAAADFSNIFGDGPDAAEKALFDQNRHFVQNGGVAKTGFAAYYYDAISGILEQDRSDDYIYIDQVECNYDQDVPLEVKLKIEDDAIFAAKCAKFVDIIRALDKVPGDNHRTIVFFDYKLDKNDDPDGDGTSWKALSAYLKANAPDLYRRTIVGDHDNIGKSIDAYNDKPDALLLAADRAYTEGQDLQSGNVIFNFEVPVDPMAMDQQIGRVHRLGQADDVQIYSFATMSRLDGYCLAYFASVGILSDKNGDATILSGCNSDKMKTMRCPHCGDMILIYESDYDEILPSCPECAKTGISNQMEPRVVRDKETGEESAEYVCKANPKHRMSVSSRDALRCSNCAEAPLRQPIVINEFVCANNPRHRIKRVKDNNYDYACLSRYRNKMRRLWSDEGDNIVGCSKWCVFQHCPSAGMGDNCALRKNKDTIKTPNAAKLICLRCNDYEKCDCRIDDAGLAGSCARCTMVKSKRMTCGIKRPYEINFGTDYQNADCPLCGGVLKQIVANTFETYVRDRYENDKEFCLHFATELEKTLQIKQIITFND